ELFAEAGKTEEALAWYRRAHEFSPESTELFDAIEGLLVKLGKKEERVEHYQTGLAGTYDDTTRVRYMHRAAALQRELGQDEQAIETLRELLDTDAQNDEALDALTELYRKNE